MVFLRDIYVLKLGADLEILSYISIFLYFWKYVSLTVVDRRRLFPFKVFSLRRIVRVQRIRRFGHRMVTR